MKGGRSSCRMYTKEWLDFRRNQFPAGSRIQTWELDDPRNTLKEARKLDYIDDSGRFHVRHSDGGECVLTLGEEMFSVHPPESTQLKLYMPLTASFYARNEWGDWDETGEEWDGRTLLDYEDRILGFTGVEPGAGGGGAGPHALVRQGVPGRQGALRRVYGRGQRRQAVGRGGVPGRRPALSGGANKPEGAISPARLRTALARAWSSRQSVWTAGSSMSTCGSRRAGASRRRQSSSG